MSILDYLFYSIVGICVVFCALIFLMLIIKVMMYQPKAKAQPASAATDATAAAAAMPTPLAPGVAGEVLLYDTDPRDAAMVMAIVADELQRPLNELRFISIREVKR